MSLEAGTYRTKSRAGNNLAEIPEKMPLITNRKFQNAMTFNPDENACLSLGQPEPWGMDRSGASTESEKRGAYNLPLLRAVYAVFLNRFEQAHYDPKSIERGVTVYLPDFARKLGKGPNISSDQFGSIVNGLQRLQDLQGDIKDRKLNALICRRYDEGKNIIALESPYMVRIIQDLYLASMRKGKRESVKRYPAYSYLLPMELAGERNRKAVEIVCAVITMIEQAGRCGTPHISAKTILERNSLLRESIDNAKSTAEKNTLLERAFCRAWELLKRKTDLDARYRNIRLPDSGTSDFKAKWIPTMSTLDMVFEFPHDGKIRGSVAENSGKCGKDFGEVW